LSGKPWSCDEVREPEARRLLHIQEAIRLIRERTRSGRELYLTDLAEQDAVLWRLYTLADAATQIPNETKAQHPEIPWEQVRGFRNVAAHGYLDLVAELAWEIIETHLPLLKSVVEQELRERGHETQ
jgi:uncharacterized protein with HEPN domain